MHVTEHALDIDFSVGSVEVVKQRIQRDLERIDRELKLTSHLIDELQFDTSPEVVI